MEIEEALYGYLSGVTAVAYLAGDHGYPLVVPVGIELKNEPGLRAAYAYQRVSGAETMDHDGEQVWENPRIQYTCVGRTYKDAKNLARAIRNAVRGYRGLMGGAGGVQVESIVIMGDVDGWAETAQTNVVRLDVEVLIRG